ncbi:MAG: ABC transporter permease [Gemmatimonadales bacterium]|nr:ABC transporter permease [Gemmatimonadales bacterium]
MTARRGGTLLTRAAEGVGLALDSVRSAKMRAALTILGIAIGVTVVIAMASMITGIQSAVNDIVERAGPKTFIVTRFFREGVNISDGSDEMSPWRRRPKLTLADAEAIRRVPAVQDINLRERASGRISFEGRDLASVMVQGMSPSWMQVQGGTLTAGRSFTGAEAVSGSFVVVLNGNAAEELFPNVDPVGKAVRLFGLPFQVIGVYQDPSGIFGQSKEPLAVIPHSTLQKTAPVDRGWMSIAVFPRAEVTQQEAMDQVVAALRVHRGLGPGQDNTFDVVSGDRFLENFNQMTQGFFLAMLALSSVGLMVGGIGVVAIMMISVTERTREIGIRKALGATRGEILFQFLVEAATLTFVGGVVGLLVGALIARAVDAFSPIPASVPLWSVAVSLVAAVVTGVLFGLYPAFRAARLDPVEALRFE